MGQNLGSELSKEDLKDLCFGLLRGCWTAATQALVDEAGSESAMKHLKPYFTNTGMAGAHNIQSIMGISSMELIRKDVISAVWPTIMSGGTQRRHRAQDGSSIMDLEDCATNGICKEGCVSLCDYTGAAYYSELDPTLRVSLVRSLSFGDRFCQWRVTVEGEEPMVSESEEFLVNRGDLPPLDDELGNYLALSIIGEAWSNATRAFVDFAGQERALDRLRFHMRHSGLSFGIRMSERFGARERGLQSILEIIELVQLLHYRKGICTMEKGSVEGKVNECPFSSSPSEICMQYEAFFNGICEAIDPSYEFRYDRMMSKGDKSCHWVIRTKGALAKEKPEEESSDDPVKRLTNKLIDGEITEEEFERKMALLKKHSVVK